MQKALLFACAFGDEDARNVSSDDVTAALVELLRSGGHKGTGLSSTTLRAAHLAGAQAFNWAMAKGIVDENPFAAVRRPRERRGQSRFLLPTQASELVSTATEEARTNIEEGTLRSWRIAARVALLPHGGKGLSSSCLPNRLHHLTPWPMAGLLANPREHETFRLHGAGRRRAPTTPRWNC